MSNLVEHAKRELALIGEEEETVQGYVKIIQAFADMGHSGGSASVAIPVIHRLLQFQNLSELTNDPEEWMFVAEDIWGEEGGIWQSKRNPEAFSNDGGNRYYLLSEGAHDQNRRPIHTAKVATKWLSASWEAPSDTAPHNHISEEN